MDTLTPTTEHPDTPDVRALLQRHVDLMRDGSPEESCHVMEPGALSGPDITLMGVRKDGVLLGVGALAQIEPGHGELKSMHTAAEARGQGVARALLGALMELARAQNMVHLSLETGTASGFTAARTLYVSEGFADCPPFGSYILDPLSVFMTRTL